MAGFGTTQLRSKGPNIALLLFLIFPFVGGAIIAISAAGVAVDSGAVVTIVPISLVSLVTAAALAARLEIAPLFATMMCLLMLIIGSCSGPTDPYAGGEQLGMTEDGGLTIEQPDRPRRSALESVGPVVVVLLMGVGLTWWRRDYYTRPWQPAQLTAWVREGFEGLLRDSPGAFGRATAGIVLALIGIFVVAVTMKPGSVPLFPVLLTTTAFGLLATSLTIRDAE